MDREGDSKWMPSASQQPPSYYSSPAASSQPQWSGHGLHAGPTACYNPGSYPQHLPVSQAPPPTAVTVTQPLIVTNNSHGQGPDTTCALIMSTLSTILCGFWCGAVAIMLAWKARMQVLDKKFEHANHSLKIVWLFVFLACLFGISIWAVVGIYLYHLTAYIYY